MSNVLPVEDLSKTYLEHAMVINNFVIKIGSQIKDSLCRVFGDGVQYESVSYTHLTLPTTERV